MWFCWLSFVFVNFLFLVAVISRHLRSVSNDNTDPGKLYIEEDQPPLDVGNIIAPLADHKNHTPDYERVEQPDSETGVNSNSSADFPSAQAAEMKLGSAGGVGALQEGSIDAAVAYEVSGSKDNWIDLNPPSVILQQHRSDEM